jgi:MoaA/NifB/PqqE/SkfB family radical SAM enzyme
MTGLRVDSLITFDCTFACDYCYRMVTGKRPKSEVKKLYEWKKFINEFPEKIKVMGITGGEPTIMWWLPDYINFLHEKKIHVNLFTNLAFPERIFEVKQISNFTVIASFHEQFDHRSEFDKKVFALRKAGYKVQIDIFGTTKKKMTVEDLKNQTGKLMIAPDLTIFLRCYDMIEHFT